MQQKTKQTKYIIDPTKKKKQNQYIIKKIKKEQC